ncbi:MAG: GNAT family N-acetyltransferase [Levilactobacillus sp.]|uniref:GNAT family N-acetyltransferase n=1 Tax=Levilactobacillus sp. TaxID=2767919 RepID=UPI00258B49C8|nr:GNAT family N-acetyltransferase [Levilactobacillus sp.]MCI1553055.1 GNAT family N-acetyltransferase [Levilactobacillus sp.]MCI1598196.1 GNAT family N-acetyltransferase [Levilactobacillus sp.]MCI1605059.1 GNAT family N-acetyltransferase [Levilactobacillus sp.]
MALEQAIPVDLYTTNASITARPFFEARGFRVVRRNLVVRDGIELINFTMKKTK